MAIKQTAIKISLLGDSMVGKTSIVNVYLGLEFTPTTLSSVGIEKQESKMKMSDGKEMKIVIWDTAGQERFQAISAGTIKNAHGIILVFDVGKKNTFDNIEKWLKEIYDKKSAIPIILLGNKCDLKERQIKKEDAEDYAENKKIPYYETSAKNNINIQESFKAIAEEAYKKIGLSSNIELTVGKKQTGKKCCGDKNK